MHYSDLVGAQRVNRGGYETHQLVNACRQNGITDLIIAYGSFGYSIGCLLVLIRVFLLNF
jgi:hypothetical protein